jgi:hypothetical protein
MFWEAAPSAEHPDGFESVTMPGTIEFGKPHTEMRPYTISLPARVTMRVRVRPMGLDVLDDLIDSGDLDAAIRDEMPTHTLASTVLEWTEAEHGYGGEVRRSETEQPEITSYRCLLDPDGLGCGDAP